MEIDCRGPKGLAFSSFHYCGQEELYPANWGEGVSCNSDDLFGE
jgi:hypothetical protein